MAQDSLEQKRDAFRNYLKQAGAIDTLTKALIKLYEQPEKPDDAVKFIRKNMCESCPDDEQFLVLQADLTAANKKIVELQKEIVILKGNAKHTESKVNVLLTKGYEELTEDEDCQSLLKKYLTEEVFEELQEETTELKCTLLDCIQSGLEHHDSAIGVYAPDSESYDTFASLFDPLIEDYHKFDSDGVQPASDWGDSSLFVDIDPEKEFVQSTRIRCGRSLEGVPFNPCMSQENYIESMEKVKNVLMELTDDLKGTFYPLDGMSEEEKNALIDSHVLFKEGDRFLQSAGASRFWPHGRAIFMNDLKTFIVWVNEEDHLRLISMDSSGNLGQVYERLSRAVAEISKNLVFSRHDRLGFLTFCPTNLGTTIRASVHIKLPKLSSDKKAFEKLAKKHFLQIRGTSGEHSESEGGVYDISNKRRLGLTEFEAVKQLQDGIAELIKLEKDFKEEETA